MNNNSQGEEVTEIRRPLVAVNQPYFLPYLGYFSLIASCDCFVVYDTVKYSKKGWISRNRILREGEIATVSIPLTKASDFSNIVERHISPDFQPLRLLRIFEGAYRKAPHWNELEWMLDRILSSPSRNLFEFLRQSLIEICKSLEIVTEIRTYSELMGREPQPQGSERIFSIMEATSSDSYINLPGGRALYSGDSFRSRGVELYFLEPIAKPYRQGGSGEARGFVERLSITDTIANIGLAETSRKVRADFLVERA